MKMKSKMKKKRGTEEKRKEEKEGRIGNWERKGRKGRNRGMKMDDIKG